jgi:excisionase family DNA binding protein
MKRLPAEFKPDEILTVSTLAEYLHCHPGTIYRMLRDKSIPGFKLGGGWRFKRSTIEQWLRKSAVSGSG